MAAPPPDRRPPTNNGSAEPTPSVEALVDELRKVLRRGLDRLDPVGQRMLLGLALVRQRARIANYPDNDDGLTLALREVITDAARALGDGPPARAARLLFGTVPDSRGRNLTDRRRLAGDALDVVASTFRRNYEPRLVHELATEILRAEHAPDLHVIDNPEPMNEATDKAPPALHVVIDPPDTVAGALHHPGPMERTVRRRPSRLEWLLVAVLVSGGLWRVGGIGAVLRSIAAALAAGSVATIAGAVKARRENGGIVRALLDRLPRLILLATATMVTVVAIAATAPGVSTVTPRPYPCNELTVDPGCQRSTVPTTTPAEQSPNFVPTTRASVPSTRAPAECPPPEKNRQRRLSFAAPPPKCINFDATYEATLGTNFGTFRVLLNTSRAPWTVNNFVYLSGWRFFEGITLSPDPQPLAAATSMRAGDPVAPEDTDKVPGYGLTFDHNTYPDLPVADDERAYVVMTDPYHPNRWAIVVAEAGRNEVELNSERWPLVGQIACGIDVITNEAPDGYYPAYTSAPIVISDVTVHEVTGQAQAELRPDEGCG